MDIRRYILKRRTDAKSRRMLWHEVVETLHLSLCASFYLDRDDVSVDNCEVVNFATRSLVCILPIEHLGFDKTIMGFMQLQTSKHLRGCSLVNKLNFGGQENVVSWQRKHGLHQAQVEKEILDIFLVLLCTQWKAVSGSMFNRDDESCQCQQAKTLLDRCCSNITAGFSKNEFLSSLKRHRAQHLGQPQAPAEARVPGRGGPAVRAGGRLCRHRL